MKTLRVPAALAAVIATAGLADAAGLQIERAAIDRGKLVISGRTAKPNQVITLMNTGDRTASLPSRRFSFTLDFMPADCRLKFQVEGEELENVLVAGCGLRGEPGKDGKDGKDGREARDGRDGKDGKDGKDGSAGIAYGSLPGDNATFLCWASDVIGLWFIRDYPSPNARTIAHVAPDRSNGGKTFNVTEPSDPLKTEKPEGPAVTQAAEFEKNRFHILNRETKARTGVQGVVSADCRSIVWKGEGETVLRTWER